MKYSAVTSLQWANQEHSAIVCEVQFEHLPAPVPFGAVPNGDYEHTHEIFARCVAGDFGPILEFVPPPALTTEELAAIARAKRDSLLAATDWTQASDVPQATKDLWVSYRRALRDVPEQAGFPSEITWPTKP